MRAHEFITEQVDEGVGMDMLAAFIPTALRKWMKKKLQKGQYEALVKVYDEIMNDPINPAENPQDALYRAAKTVGLDQRTIYAMFGEKGVPSTGKI